MLSPIIVSGRCFTDGHGRQIILRGVNLGGDSKVPFPNGGTETPTDFHDHRSVSFVGRPFPIEEADEHLARLRHWGFNCLRLIFTWEAVEHKGPGVYDTAFLDYYEAVVDRAAAHGLYVFADPHQDVWSRMTGGDGAPGWTLEAVGFDIDRIKVTGAAHVMQNVYDYASSQARQGAYPQMSWSSNYTLPANAIMWSLFWLGRELTPDFMIEGRNVQDFLQGSYLGALDQVARRLAGKPNVLGFDTLNEPHVGWLGRSLSGSISEATPATKNGMSRGFGLSPLEGLALAGGRCIETPWLDATQRPGFVALAQPTLNPAGASLWRDEVTCPFRRAGIYTIADTGDLIPLRENAFCEIKGRPLSIERDAFHPFFHSVASTVRRHNANWSLFAELDAAGPRAGRTFPRDMPARSVNASHWYDGSLLYGKKLRPAGGADRFSEADQGAHYAARIAAVAGLADTFEDPGPSLLGEFGIPYDLNDGEAYARWSAGARGEELWREHEIALDLMYNAIDRELASATQWNYTASNRNDLRIGDRWNQEDLSIFSRDQQDNPLDPNSGGRAVNGFCRPYARAVQGRAKLMRFDRRSGAFEFQYDADETISAPTEIYLPRRQFPEGVDISADGAPVSFRLDANSQLLIVSARSSGAVALRVTRRPAETHYLDE